jgi:hypothetical protein
MENSDDALYAKLLARQVALDSLRRDLNNKNAQITHFQQTQERLSQRHANLLNDLEGATAILIQTRLAMDAAPEPHTDISEEYRQMEIVDSLMETIQDLGFDIEESSITINKEIKQKEGIERQIYYLSDIVNTIRDDIKNNRY